MVPHRAAVPARLVLLGLNSGEAAAAAAIEKAIDAEAANVTASVLIMTRSSRGGMHRNTEGRWRVSGSRPVRQRWPTTEQEWHFPCASVT